VYLNLVSNYIIPTNFTITFEYIIYTCFIIAFRVIDVIEKCIFLTK